LTVNALIIKALTVKYLFKYLRPNPSTPQPLNPRFRLPTLKGTRIHDRVAERKGLKA
jgi:hypothetical protein